MKKILNYEEYFKNPFGTINDLLGVRVITFIKSDLDKVSEIIENEFDLLKGPDDKSEKLSSREFGYRSIHFIVRLNERRTKLCEYEEYKDLRAEIQIRTIIENAWDEVEHHWNYKPERKDSPLNKSLKHRLYALMAVLELVDQEFDSIREEFQDEFIKDEIWPKAINNFFQNPEIFDDLCDYLVDNENYKELVQLTKEAVKINDKNINAWKNMSLGLLNLNKYEELLDASKILINLNPTITAGYIGKGYAFSNLKKYTEALTCYNKALEIDPKHTLALINKGLTLSDLGKDKVALEWIDKALALKPEYVYALMIKGLVLGKLKKHEIAQQSFDKALEFEPNNTEILLNKGALLADLGKYDEAIQFFDEVLKLEPEWILPLVNKSLALVSLKNYEGASEWIDKAMNIEPENYKVLGIKALVLDGLGQYGESTDFFSKSIQNAPEEYNFKGTILNMSNRVGEALELLNKKLEPEQEEIQTRFGIIQVKTGNHEEALKWFNSVLGNNPKNKIALMGKSFALGKLEKYEDALGTLKILLKNNPNNAPVLYMVARIQSLNGKNELAIANLNNAINLDEQYKLLAKNDKAFKNIKDIIEFKKLTSK